MSSKNYSRNHFIPEGYLKGFALPDNNIYQLKISDNFVDSKISKKGLKQVCFKWDLYTIKNDITYSEFDIIDDSKFIEKNCFTDIENKIGETISRIQNEYFKIEEKQLICDFILLSITRHPKNLELFKSKYTPEMHIEYLEENKEDVIANARCANDLRPFEELKKSYLEVLKTRKEFDIDNLAKSYLHSTLLNLALNPEYERRTIFKNNTFRQFTIYKSITGLDFVTSLHPANSFHPQTGFNDNLLDKSSYTIPLNKNMVLEIGGGAK